MKNINEQFIKSIKFSYQENNKEINYEEFIFNGIPIPKDIEFKDIKSFSFNASWKIENMNLNINDIKYRIEIKEKDKNFKQICEGNNMNFTVDNLVPNTNYEIRICSVIKENKGEWTEIQKIKTKELSSVILEESPKKEEFIKKLKEWTEFKNMELIYRATRDGGDNINFHKKCDNQGQTLVLCKNDKGNIFGGYVAISWTSNNSGYNSASGSFLFTLTNIHNIDPTKFQSYNNSNHVYHGTNKGPTFGNGCDLWFYMNFLNNNNCQTGFPTTYQDNIGKGKSIFTGDLNNNNINIKLIEMEVFTISK